jgi:hypothetical protein
MIGGASALGISVLMALPAALPALAAPAPIKTIRPGHALYDVGIHPGITPAQARASARAGTTVPEFTASVKVGAKTFTYSIVGKNPAKKVSNASTTVNAEIVPVIMKFSNGDTWTPTKTDSCDTGATPLARTQNSPIVKTQAHKFGGTSVGTVQVTNAFQRAEFWKDAKPGGINPSYGVNLAFKTLKPVTINVPIADEATASIGCGNGLLGAAEINWLDNHLQTVVIPSLKSQGVGTTTFPIFLLHNFVEYIGNTSQCCVLGYHNVFSTAAGAQTYGLAMYDNSGFFTGSSDISALSHEVAEWQNDPNTVGPNGGNPTPSWGNIGQVMGCQANLEVGDPLSGTTFKDALGGFTYHPQELAFFSWFYHQSPSLGVNGWYSDQGKFRTFAAPC